IFDLLPIEDILALERTSQRMKDLKEQYCKSVFRISRVIMPFVDNENQVQVFVQMMKETNALISGSTALQFFDRTRYHEADLDLYFEARYIDLWKTQMVAFGYSLMEKTAASASVVEGELEYRGFEEIESVESFKHPGSNQVVQLMATKASPIRAILDFHSTCVMNVITYQRAYSLYPVCTFIDRETLVCGVFNKKSLEALKKYERRGWIMVHAIRTENFQCAADELKMRTRRFGDDRCWMISLEGEKKDMCSVEGHNISWHISLTKYAKTERFVPRMVIKNS
ncbi:hypothetical protein F5887DRAFT_898771, partial [Amanita rubescens]